MQLSRQVLLGDRRAGERALAFSSGQMGHFTKACGSRAKQRDTDAFCCTPAMSTAESGNETRPKGKECIFTKMGLGMKEGGIRTSLKALAGKSGLMAVTLKASTNRVTRAALVCSSGKMELSTGDTGSGQKCTDTERFHGRMGAFTEGFTRMT